MDYLEFVARVTSRIPDRGQIMVRYYGLYSNTISGSLSVTVATRSFLACFNYSFPTHLSR